MISRKTTISVAALLLASAGAAAAFPATATTDLNVRSGPGTGYSVVDSLEAGDTVEIVATRGSWYRTAEGGWASASYLDAGGQVSYVDEGYADYGTVSYYYNDYPAYYDNAGFYFYVRDGRRHRVDRGDLREARREVRRERNDVQEARGIQQDLRGERRESRQELRQLRQNGGTDAQIDAARGELRQDRQAVRQGRASLREERRELRGAQRELMRERAGQ